MDNGTAAYSHCWWWRKMCHSVLRGGQAAKLSFQDKILAQQLPPEHSFQCRCAGSTLDAGFSVQSIIHHFLYSKSVFSVSDCLKILQGHNNRSTKVLGFLLTFSHSFVHLFKYLLNIHIICQAWH